MLLQTLNDPFCYTGIKLEFAGPDRHSFFGVHERCPKRREAAHAIAHERRVKHDEHRIAVTCFCSVHFAIVDKSPALEMLSKIDGSCKRPLVVKNCDLRVNDFNANVRR